MSSREPGSFPTYKIPKEVDLGLHFSSIVYTGMIKLKPSKVSHYTLYIWLL